MKKTLIESLVSMATELCNRGQNPWLAAANAVKLLKEPVTPEDMKAVDDELKRRFSGREPKPWETEQPDLFGDIEREACYPAPTGADAALSALESEAAYVLSVLCHYWRTATTRKDWKRLDDWLDVLASNASLYQSRDLLHEYFLLQRITVIHRHNLPVLRVKS